jgi:hypothetical protein
MPLYRSISTVSLGDGVRTAVWTDDWLGLGALCSSMLALFSHAFDHHVYVAAVVRNGLRPHLVPRLTTVGAAELASVDAMLRSVRLSNCDDTRSLARCAKKGGKLHAALLYKLSFDMGAVVPLCCLHLG